MMKVENFSQTFTYICFPPPACLLMPLLFALFPPLKWECKIDVSMRVVSCVRVYCAAGRERVLALLREPS